MVANTGRNERIDTVRGIAITWVFLIHIYASAKYSITPIAAWFNSLPHSGGWYNKAIDHSVHQTALGVNLFWFVSGFCIHTSFLKWWSRAPQENRKLARFLPTYAKARFFRVYPAYVLVILVCFVISYWGRLDEMRSYRQLMVHVTCLQNYFTQFRYNMNPPCWSIAVELQRYAIYPILLILWIKAGTTRAFIICFTLSLLFRFTPFPSSSTFSFWYNPFTCWLGWLTGALLAERWQRNSQLFRWHPLLVATGITAYVAAEAGVLPGPVAPLSQPLIYAIAFEWYIFSNTSLNGLERITGWIGSISFSLYLIHKPIMDAMFTLFSRFASGFPGMLGLAIMVAITAIPTVVLGRLFYIYIERPLASLGGSKGRPAEQSVRSAHDTQKTCMD